MCGIFGLYYSKNNSVDLDLVEHATTSIRHRGPDDEGYLLVNTFNGSVLPCGGTETDPRLCLPSIRQQAEFEANLAFGFRRLSILDLSPLGHQPMSNKDGRLWIVFNGEVYNYVELRNELSLLGHTFISGSDTEVILASYQEWGKDCLRRFVGMFAFAILDQRSSETKLFLARDPFGIKPLYYTIAGGYFAFASEIKALIDLPGVSRKVHPQNLNDYLRRGITDHNADTMFADIKHLPPAHYVEINYQQSNLCIRPVNYWRIDPDYRVSVSFKEAAETLRHLFLENIRLHLRSDVPVGAALSGGIDSSSIVASMRHLEPVLAIHTFTYLAEDVAINEERWADIVAKSSNAIAHKTQPGTEQLVADLDNLIYTQDEPFGSTSIFAQHRVFQLAREVGIKVMLDGQGADELLAGYPIYWGARFSSLMRHWKMMDALRFKRRSFLHTKQIDLPFFLLTAGAAILPQSLHLTARRLTGKDNISAALNDNWFNERNVIPSASITPSKGRDVLREQLVESTVRTGLPSLLRYEDRNSMAHSIESRVPFLTTRLAEFVLALPEKYLISDEGVSKYVFRGAMRGIVPDKILDRLDKIGFQTPEKPWLSKLGPWVENILSNQSIMSLPILNNKAILNDWGKALNNERPFDFRIWRYLNLIVWAQRYKATFE